MDAALKKIILNELNGALNKALDETTVPAAVSKYAYDIIRNKDHYGWYTKHHDNRIFGSNIYCAACKKESTWPLINSRQTINLICPHCGNTIYVRKDGCNQRFYIHNKDAVCYFQNSGGTIVARFFMIGRYYTDYDYKKTPNIMEYQRWFIREGSISDYLCRYMWYASNKGSYEWNLKKSVRVHIKGYAVINSPENIHDVFKDTAYEKIAWLDSKENASLTALYKFITWPSLEYLSKLGYDELVKEIVAGRKRDDKALNLYARKANAVLGVPHSILQKYDHKRLRERDIKAIKQLISFGRLGQLTPERMKFISSILTNDSLDPLDIFRPFGLEKVLNYVYKQIEVGNRISGEAECSHGYRSFTDITVWNDFVDYRKECHQLGYDLTDEGIMFPKNLFTAHTRTTELLRERAAEIRAKELAIDRAQIAIKFINAVKPYLKKEFSDDKLLFRVCKTPEELYKESAMLKHCVSSYDKRVAAKSCIIFFIRAVNNPDKPFYTLEYNPKNGYIVQLRGFANCAAEKNIYSFAENCIKRLNTSGVAL